MGKVNKSTVQFKAKFKRNTINVSAVDTIQLRGRAVKRVVVRNNQLDRTMESVVKKVDALELDGNISEKWRVFKQNFDIFATAIELSKKPEAVRIAVFLNAVGPDAVETYNSFEIPETEKVKYNSVVKAFSDFCEPKKNDVYETYVFHSRNQRESEPFDNFLMDLKKQVRKCDFGPPPLPDRMLRDRIVMGVSDQKLQKRLLETQDLDVKKAIEMARAAEVTLKQMKDMQKSSSLVTSQSKSSADAVSRHADKDKYNKFSVEHKSGVDSSKKGNDNVGYNRVNEKKKFQDCVVVAIMLIQVVNVQRTVNNATIVAN